MRDGWWVALILAVLIVLAVVGGYVDDHFFDPGFGCGRVSCD